MKKFNLEAAKKGAAVCTRDGRKARIVCWDTCFKNFPILALITDPRDGEESVGTFTVDGLGLVNSETDADLMMAPVKKEGWVRLDPHYNDTICLEHIYPTKDEALKNIREDVIVAHIEWEADE